LVGQAVPDLRGVLSEGGLRLVKRQLTEGRMACEGLIAAKCSSVYLAGTRAGTQLFRQGVPTACPQCGRLAYHQVVAATPPLARSWAHAPVLAVCRGLP